MNILSYQLDETYEALPVHMQQGFKRWVLQGIPLGGFGMAVVSNNLKEAIAKADEFNLARLRATVSWLYNVAPAWCWGSPEKVKAWKGLLHDGN